MCSNYKDDRSAKELAEFYKAELPVDFGFAVHRFPWAESPVVVKEGGERVLKLMHFGMGNTKDLGEEKPKPIVYNARSETVAKFPAFAEAFLQRRCLVPMQGFYEYVEREGLDRKMRIWIAPKDGRPLTAAGIWNFWRSQSGVTYEAYAILTEDPPPVIAAAGHDRCPVFLHEDAWDAWLDESQHDPRELHRILQQTERVEWAIRDEPLNVKPKSPRAKAGMVGGKDLKPAKPAAKRKAMQESLL